MELYEIKDWALFVMLLTKTIGFYLMLLNVIMLPVMLIGGRIDEKKQERKGTPITNEERILNNVVLTRVIAFAVLGFCLLNLSDHSFIEISEVLQKKHQLTSILFQ